MIISNRKRAQGDLINDKIPFREMMVISVNGDKLGVLSKNAALEEARKLGLDLLVVSPNSDPVVARILDYGKHKYEQQKRAREQRKNQVVQELKSTRLSPVIDVGDFDTKVRQAVGWLKEGNKVKADMRFRGRQITRQSVGREVMNEFIAALSEYGEPASRPRLDGYTMSVVINPKK
ncbi:MAG: translation initiation factor IF-3 [Erysipelothrix sp.]|nr:translation initiation factor IF-3 [Erysipelothrix sp.]